MEVKFIPEVCKGESPRFAGTITLKVPSFDERYKFIEDCGVNISDSGGVELKASNFSIIRNMVKLSEPFYVSVEMKRIDGVEFKSFSDLTHDPECDGILIEVAKEIRSGFRPAQK